MISTTLHGLAHALRENPQLAGLVAEQIDAMADDVARLEAAVVPDRMRAPVALPDGVTRLAEWRRKA